MKKLIFLLGFFVFQSQSFVAQGVSFEHGSWDEVLEKAKSENKLIFMDAYTTWCGPCKMMQNNVFPSSDVGEFYNENFINVKMDMERGEGVGLAQKYTVVAYPTLLYLDYSGEVVHRTAGYYGAVDFIDLGKTALAPEKRLSGLNAAWEKGNRESSFLEKYTAALAFAMDNKYMEVANAYIESQGDLGTEQNMEFVMQYVDDIDSKGFKYFVENRAQFEEKYGFGEVEGKVQNALNAFISKDPEQPFENIEKTIRQLYGSEGEKMAASYKMEYARQRGDRPGYVDAAVAFLDKYPSKDSELLNEIAWTFYQIAEDKSDLKKAVKWAKQSVKSGKSYYNMDTLAALYLKLKKRKKAIKTAKKAIELAKKSGDDYSETQKVLDEAYKL